jgi:hypothetical protein
VIAWPDLLFMSDCHGLLHSSVAAPKAATAVLPHRLATAYVRRRAAVESAAAATHHAVLRR